MRVVVNGHPLRDVRHSSCCAVVALWTGGFSAGASVMPGDLRLPDGSPYVGPIVCPECDVVVRFAKDTLGRLVAGDHVPAPRGARIGLEIVQ